MPSSEPPVIDDDPVTRAVYATDNSIYQVTPGGVAVPTSARQVADLLAANHRGSRRPIVARGAGTGTNGQSLTDGVMVDLKRGLDRIGEIDPARGTAVVEPGVVTAALNAELAPHGLFWAPHTSTLNRATVGGMIATDAAGKGSLVHGRTHRHVLALDVVLDDGTPWRAEPTSLDAANRAAAADDRVGALWRSLLELPVAEGVDLGLPELARGFSGYGIDRFRRDGMVDPVALLCGSEGTLAVITAATLRLTARPAHTVLFIVGYPTFDRALDDAVDLAATAPTAIECFDETTLEQGRSSVAWPALAEVVGDEPGAVLLLEYSGDRPPDLAAIHAEIARTGRSRAVAVVDDPARQAAAWKVRADAVGLLAKVVTGGPGRAARPTAMVEDCAVPVAAMGSFIAGFRRILDDAGLTYGMFGHADVGCVHVRPALDLTDPDHEQLVRVITDRVVALVAEHGGVLWGEHGRGFRGDVAPSFLSPPTMEVMRRVKAAFDPDDLLNPGKLYRPLGSSEPIVALDEAPLRGQRNRSIPIETRVELADAFACNGNGLCHHYDGAEVMCPSYKVTGDPALSPKGRADLIRAWLAAEATGADDADELGRGLVENLDRCLSCSACSGHCPVEVDIPELKSRVLDRYYRRRRRPGTHALLSRFERLAGAGSRIPRPLGRLGAASAGRALGLIDLPAPRSAGGRTPRWRPGRGTDVVIMPDVFSATFEPSSLADAVDVLGRLGYDVAVAPFVPSGKFDHVKGRRQAFARAAAAQARMVERIVADGAVPVVVEPAIALLHAREYPAINPDHPTAAVRNLVEVVADRAELLRPPRPDGPSGSGYDGPVTVLGHCTERATAPGWLAAWLEVLKATGREVVAPPVGCCGMAGIFGHEVANQDLSRRLYELSWADPIASATGPVAATGYSCREQCERFGGRRPLHPVSLL